MTNKTNKNTIHTNNNTNTANVVKKKKQSRIKDYTKYNKSLKNRAKLTLLVSPAVFLPSKATKQAGRPKSYSDELILFLAQIREIFQLPFRQTMGLAESLAALSGLSLPEYNTLCTRMQKLNVSCPIERQSNKPVCLLIDSTGLKTKGEGEWKVRKHGAGYRRGWRKLHITLDYNTQQITAHTQTSERVVDQEPVIPLLDYNLKNNTCTRQLIGDGAYGSHKLYTQVEKERKISLLSPPRKNAKLHVRFKETHSGRRCSGGKYADFIDEVGWETQNRYLRDCIHLGWDEWKKQIDYHKRSLVETAMWRLKSAFSDKLKSKTEANLNNEIAIRINLLNYWTKLDQNNYIKA